MTTTHGIDGATMLRHLADISRLSGHPRTMYLVQHGVRHGPAFRAKLERIWSEDLSKRERAHG